MSYYSRLQKAFKGALRLPLNPSTKYVLFSDCHRGTGTANDNFLKNQTLYTAALRYYHLRNFTYIENGDGDELWENRDLQTIIDSHSEVFRLLCGFYNRRRIYFLYVNHDLEKRKLKCQYFPDVQFYEGIILENSGPGKDIFLTHGHQADLLNSTFWKLSRFLVRYLWKPLERYGVSDPTSAAKNNTRKQKTELHLQKYATNENLILIAGHTHRPVLNEKDLSYCNCGSCVHPYSITCIEIEHMHISLIKWTLSSRPDMILFVSREMLSGPFPIN